MDDAEISQLTCNFTDKIPPEHQENYIFCCSITFSSATVLCSVIGESTKEYHCKQQQIIRWNLKYSHSNNIGS